MDVNRNNTGALALAGSGEYTPAMRDTDALLLDTVGGATSARVVVLPTAAGHEHPSSPGRWATMGVNHFRALGARTDAAMIVTRQDAQDPGWLPLLESADLIYFSGGDPEHLIHTMRDTPAWNTIVARYSQGAVLAGCSAGAMAFGGWSPQIRGIMSGGPIERIAALGIVPHIMALPHFDRLGKFVPLPLINKLIEMLPSDLRVVGIDEDTAMVRMPGETKNWLVTGRQSVTVFDRSAPGGKTVFRSGQEFVLPE